MLSSVRRFGMIRRHREPTTHFVMNTDGIDLKTPSEETPFSLILPLRLMLQVTAC